MTDVRKRRGNLTGKKRRVETNRKMTAAVFREESNDSE